MRIPFLTPDAILDCTASTRKSTPIPGCAPPSAAHPRPWQEWSSRRHTHHVGAPGASLRRLLLRGTQVGCGGLQDRLARGVLSTGALSSQRERTRLDEAQAVNVNAPITRVDSTIMRPAYYRLHEQQRAAGAGEQADLQGARHRAQCSGSGAAGGSSEPHQPPIRDHQPVRDGLAAAPGAAAARRSISPPSARPAATAGHSSLGEPRVPAWLSTFLSPSPRVSAAHVSVTSWKHDPRTRADILK